MFQATIDPVAGSLGLSALVACIPLATFFIMLLGVKARAHVSAIIALIVAVAVACIAFQMPLGFALASATQGAAFGAIPIVYIILMAGTLLITLLLSVYFVGKTTRPVRELAEKAASIAAKGGVLAGDSPRETDRIMTVIESLNDQIERLSGDNIELERRERDANILMLEMQINPHFL
jgi:hypothetical protein